MKNKSKPFLFLDPTSAQPRHNRVQFMLDDTEYEVLESAAAMQGIKPGELVGAIFRKHILPGLSEEVARLRAQPEKPLQPVLGTHAVQLHNGAVPTLRPTDQTPLREMSDGLLPMPPKNGSQP